LEAIAASIGEFNRATWQARQVQLALLQKLYPPSVARVTADGHAASENTVALPPRRARKATTDANDST